MQIDSILQNIDREIQYHQRREAVLSSEKEKYSIIQSTHPNAAIHGRNLCLDDIWSSQSRMRLKSNYQTIDGQWVENIMAQFPADHDKSFPDMRIFSGNYKNVLATARKAEITIHDYSTIIPDECPKKEKFIDRIRLYIFRHCCDYRYEINPASYELSLYQKWIMLK